VAREARGYRELLKEKLEEAKEERRKRHEE